MIAAANVQSFAPDTVERLSTEYEATFFDELASSYALQILRTIGVKWVVIMFYPEDHDSEKDVLLTVEKSTGKEKFIQLISLIAGEDGGVLDLKKKGPWWSSLPETETLDQPGRIRKNRWNRIFKHMPKGSVYSTVFPDEYAKRKVKELSKDQGSGIWALAEPMLNQMNKSKFFSLSFQVNPQLSGHIRVKMNEKEQVKLLNERWRSLMDTLRDDVKNDENGMVQTDHMSSRVLEFLIRGMHLRLRERVAIMEWSK